MKKWLIFILCLTLSATFYSCDMQSKPKGTTVESSQVKIEEKSEGEKEESNGYEEAVAAEVLRHKKVLAELEADYIQAIHDCDVEINCQKVGCYMSESECQNKIKEIDKKISERQEELRRIPSSGNSIGGGSSGVNVAKRTNLILAIQKLQSERSQYNSILQKYKTIRSLEQKKILIENTYIDAVLAECDLHEEQLEKIKK